MSEHFKKPSARLRLQIEMIVRRVESELFTKGLSEDMEARGMLVEGLQEKNAGMRKKLHEDAKSKTAKKNS